MNGTTWKPPSNSRGPMRERPRARTLSTRPARHAVDGGFADLLRGVVVGRTRLWATEPRSCRAMEPWMSSSRQTRWANANAGTRASQDLYKQRSEERRVGKECK